MQAMRKVMAPLATVGHVIQLVTPEISNSPSQGTAPHRPVAMRKGQSGQLGCRQHLFAQRGCLLKALFWRFHVFDFFPSHSNLG